MEKRQEKSSVVLKYAKRRYDGGSEIETIRTIEAKRQHALEQKMAQFSIQKYGVEVQPLSQSGESELALVTKAPASQQRVSSVEKANASRANRLFECVITGPLHFCVGVVGMITAVLGLITFRRANNPEMIKQSEVIFEDCRKSFFKGIWDTFTTPVRLVKVLIKG